VGLKAARNEWIATAEPELCFRTDVLAQFAQLQSEHPGDVISAGHIWFAPDGYQFSGQLPQGAKEAVGWVAPYAALWGRRQALLDLGGWDEGFPGYWGWDDTDLLTRLRISGHGQHIATEVEAIHLFHGLGRDENSVNEQHFYRKSFTHGQEKHQCSAECQADPDQTRDLIANRGRAWGEPKPRP
jgi:GT2 family glycosyltransferase